MEKRIKEYKKEIERIEVILNDKPLKNIFKTCMMQKKHLLGAIKILEGKQDKQKKVHKIVKPEDFGKIIEADSISIEI